MDWAKGSAKQEGYIAIMDINVDCFGEMIYLSAHILCLLSSNR